jgi:hypothetical protein
MRSEFFEAARASRAAVAPLLPAALLEKVQAWLADYRAERGRP